MPRRSRLTGLTLVEVLAAVALLGTLLAASLIAAGRAKVQAADARRRLEAVERLDALLEDWWAQKDEIRIDATGPVGKDGRWQWRTRTVSNESAGAVEARVVAVEIRPAGEADQPPAARVEILLPAAGEPGEPNS
jgi:type II secretory pathway pseudopilin PulG